MNKNRLLIAISVGHLIAACAPEPESPGTETAPDVLGPGEVAIVGGERIPESIFRLYALAALQRNAEDLSAAQRDQVIERLISMQLLADEAERRGLHEERRIAAELELQRLQILASNMTQRFIDDNPPTEAELREIYQARLAELEQTEYKVRHILVDTEAEANEIIADLQAGADFAELAGQRSTDTANANDGGDLGWAPASNWVEPFADAVRAATPGEIPEAPVQTRFGWHVVLVDEVAEQVAPGLESVRQELIIAAENQKLNDFAAELRESVEVEVVGE